MNWKILLLAAMVSGCSFGERKTDPSLEQIESQINTEPVRMFESANQAIDEGQFNQAIPILEDLLVRYPSHQLYLVSLYNLGVAYLGDIKCEQAKNRFKEVVRRSEKGSPTMKANGMLRLADAYSCLGEDDKSVLNLISLWKIRNMLDPDLAAAELPAKLATAYARMGNQKQSSEYFKIAEKGLVRIQADAGRANEQKVSLARTLHNMGDMSQIDANKMTANDYLITLMTAQKYLFQAVEMDVRPWSDEAARQLTAAYDRVWDYMDSVSIAGLPPKAREVKAAQTQIAADGVMAVKALFRFRTPDPNEPARIKSLVLQMTKQERQFQYFITQNNVGNPLTQEAQLINSIRPGVKVKNPDPYLEKLMERERRNKK
jgi:tetratricopeptide (TPR) repeat protein